MTCLPLKYLSGWLFGVNAARVRAQLRERLIHFQEECYDVLADAFQEGRLVADESFESLLRRADPEIVRAYEVAQAVVRLARNQILLEARLTGRLDEHERRLEDLEVTLGDTDHHISPAQAMAISQAVKTIPWTLMLFLKLVIGFSWGNGNFWIRTGYAAAVPYPPGRDSCRIARMFAPGSPLPGRAL
jgi:hypothetical protein